MDLEGDYERRGLGEEPEQTGDESLNAGAASRPRSLLRDWTAVERVKFTGKEGVAREEVQHLGNFALSLQTTRAM